MGCLDYVNVRQGTLSMPRYSNGNTLPLTQWPYGMISFAPQTDGRDSWWYRPLEPAVEGIRLTHQPSPWIKDYGTLLVLPQADIIANKYIDGWSGYDPEQTVLRPEYLKIKFLRSQSILELSPGKRGAYVTIAFEKNWERAVSLFGVSGSTHFEWDEKNKSVKGWTDGCQSAYVKDFKMYFVLKPIGDWLEYKQIRKVGEGSEKAGIHLILKKEEKAASFVISISYISYDQACINAQEFQCDTSIEQVRVSCADAWEDYLSRLKIEGDENRLKTFYSCMYRTGLFPHMAYEETKDGQAVHYSPYTGRIHPGVRYTDNGFWDTYRTAFPLYSMINRSLYRDVMESALHDYEEGGWLPRWTAMGESGCMPSTLVDSVIAQAVTEKIVDEKLSEKLLEAMIHHANTPSPEVRYGRVGIKEYLQYGYVPADSYQGSVGYNLESVNLTLDFAYGDYCIAQVAKALGKHNIEKEYLQRSQNYRNLYDPATGFIRAKLRNGTFKEPFDPDSWGADYTEASAWQTFFSVPHDLAGLCELIGGKEAMIERLDKVINNEPIYRVAGYGHEIHEMTEMALTGIGMCEINNQPGFSIPYLYAFYGESEKSRKLVEKICEEQFSSQIDGFPGDEDNGSMAAWYILSCIGKYPICPADSTWLVL